MTGETDFSDELPAAPKASYIIRRLLYYWLEWRVSFILPNYTPRDWWECDVFEITKSGYFKEYEVKVTRGDFFRDADKLIKRWPKNLDDPRIVEKKHDLLQAGNPRGPKSFYYVTPAGLVTESEVPIYAGLIEIDSDGRFTEVKKAPVLHRRHFSLKAMTAARRSCYWRMHDALIASKSIKPPVTTEARI